MKGLMGILWALKPASVQPMEGQFALGRTNGCVADAIWVICQLRVRVRHFQTGMDSPSEAHNTIFQVEVIGYNLLR